MLALLNRNIERWALLVFYTMLVATMAVEVIRREVFAYSSIWGEEIVRYAFIYLAWIGAAAAVRERAHIRIDVLFNFVSPRVKTLLYILGDLVMLVMAVLAVWWSLETVAVSWKFGSVTHGLRVSLVWFLLAVPIGFSLMVFRLVQSLWRDINDLIAGRPVYEGARLFDWGRAMLWNQMGQEAPEIGWDFIGPVIFFVVLIALGVPVWAAIGASAVAMLLISEVLPLSLLGESLFDGIDHFALTAVPLFILTGDVLVRTGLSRKFLDVAEALTNWARGGFGSATVLVCGMFSAISGSDAAGAAAVGRMTIARLVESGYPRPYACALVAAGACTGILIPPSIAYIVIGLVLGISASTLFQAALIPGVLILVSILVTNIVVNRRHAYEGGGLLTFGEWAANLGKAVKSGWYAFLVPGVIFWGIFSGKLTPTEAGATAVVITIIMGFILGTLKLSDFPDMMVSSAKVNGVILPIIAMSLPLAQTMAALGVPQGFVFWVTSLTDNPYVLILLMIAILIAAGCVMETTPNIVILAPILKPLADEIGMNEIQFCIMMITALGVGFITPPLGLNLFVVSGLTGESILKIAARAVPFVFFMLLVTLMIAYLPTISTLLLPDIYK